MSVIDGPQGVGTDGKCADPTCPCHHPEESRARIRKAFWRGFRSGVSLAPLWRWIARRFR